MGFLGFLNLILKCVDLLAWPLFALGYPLCASIRAIETNSNYHMRKLVTYWILFSLISLFELAFVKLIEWVPLWPYVKLGTICWMVLPQFKGAHYCYKSFVHPCLSVNLKEVMNRLYKRQEASLGKDIFLSVAERYVSENGTEALEKLIASKGSRTDFGVDEIKAVAEAEKKEMSPTVKSCCNEFNVNQEDINKVELPEKNAPVAANWSYCNEFNADQKEINEVELPGKHGLVAANWVKLAETVLVQAEKKTIAAVEVKEVTVPPAPPAVEVKPAETVLVQAEKKTNAAVEVKEVTVPPSPPAVEVKPAETVLVQAEKKTFAAVEVKEVTVPPSPPAAVEKVVLEKVQKEWTCALCQVTTTCEANLKSHLFGTKHRAKCEELKAIKQTAKNKASSSSSSSSYSPASKAAPANQNSKKFVSGDQYKDSGKQKRNNNSNSGSKHLKTWCSYCAVMCKSEIDFLSHLNGKKHLAKVQERVQETTDYSAGVSSDWS